MFTLKAANLQDFLREMYQSQVACSSKGRISVLLRHRLIHWEILLDECRGYEGRLQALEQENQLLKQEVAAIKNQSSGQSPSGKLPAGSSSPEISVMKKDGKFVVTGSGFLASRSISIRAVATNNPQDFRITSQNSESNGSLRLEWALSCNAGTPFTVTASDSRVISGNQLWSNPYQITC